MGFAFIESPQAVGPKCLHCPDQRVSIIMANKSFPLQRNQFASDLDIVLQQFIPDRPRQIGFGVQQHRGHIVLQRASSSSLIVDEIELVLKLHDVAGLKVPIKKILPVGLQ